MTSYPLTNSFSRSWTSPSRSTVSCKSYLEAAKKRVLENLAAVHHMFIWLAMPILSVWLPLYVLLCTRLWWTLIFYAAWFIYDFKTPRQGSRQWDWYRRWAVWRHFAEYFPIRLVKTAELPPDRNYIMGLFTAVCCVADLARLNMDWNKPNFRCHPHGIFAIAPFTNLCTEGTSFSEKYPGLRSTVLTLNGQFWFPLRRELGLALGGVESSAESLCYLLRNPGHGRLIGIVIGGSEEIFDSVPGVYDLVLLARKGFCRYALTSGAALVPSYNFGENDVYKQYHFPRGSFMRKVQSFIKRLLGFAPPIFFGKSKWPILPIRHPITTVVGAPLIVKGEKKQQQHPPTRLQVEALHSLYCVALAELFEKHKRDYGVHADAHLNFH